MKRQMSDTKLLCLLRYGVSKLKEVIIDILFAGLLVVPLVLNFTPRLVKKLITTFDRSIAKSNSYLLSLPISVYLIYELSTKSNWAANLGLFVAFVFFFTIYASAIACLFQRADKHNKRLNSDNV
ncbi:hypothetical protein ATS71_06995 [Pseudoalteromonas sp. H71]|nr:hypothetical protein ATS71_06995 [Pseudoalteromonas sp. H71]|tara:strand:- start:1996 stop:2370 length:375 start_codon:yes stop_codon:yes gene_type:complete